MTAHHSEADLHPTLHQRLSSCTGEGGGVYHGDWRIKLVMSNLILQKSNIDHCLNLDEKFF